MGNKKPHRESCAATANLLLDDAEISVLVGMYADYLALCYCYKSESDDDSLDGSILPRLLRLWKQQAKMFETGEVLSEAGKGSFAKMLIEQILFRAPMGLLAHPNALP